MYYVKDTKGYTRSAGRSRAIVIDNRDPEQRGQIQVNHPLLGETVWIPYLRTPGAFDVPSIGDIVYLECDSGHYEYPVAWGNLTKGTSSDPKLPEAFKRDVPTNRGFFTPGGHLIEFDDGEAIPGQDPNNSEQTTKSRGIRITTSEGSKIHVIDDNQNGDRKILLQDADGNLFVIDRENGSMDQQIDGKWNVSASDTAKIVSVNNTTIEAGEVLIKSTTNIDLQATDNINTSASGDTKIVSLGETTLEASNVKIDSPNTDVTGNFNVTGNSQLGGGTPLLLGTALLIGIGNLGVPVISSVMTGLAGKVTGS